MTAPAVHRQRLWLAIALALTVLKLWLTRGQGVFALGSAGHDDRLFIELAQHLIRGEWLGPYNELTLAKGPFYSLFIAAAFWCVCISSWVPPMVWLVPSAQTQGARPGS